MARPIDAHRHRERRMRIIDAGLTVFAREGYAGATTAAICREAGISSGAFFHYFPKKVSLLNAILQQARDEGRDFFTQRQDRTDAVGVIWEYVDHELESLEDPRAAGFIAAVGGAALAGEAMDLLREVDRQAREALAGWIVKAQESGDIRSDLNPERIAAWTMLLINGFADQVGGAPGFNAAVEKPLLHSVLHHFLIGSGQPR